MTKQQLLYWLQHISLIQKDMEDNKHYQAFSKLDQLASDIRKQYNAMDVQVVGDKGPEVQLYNDGPCNCRGAKHAGTKYEFIDSFGNPRKDSMGNPISKKSI